MRADVYLTEHGYAPSRRRAQELIESGSVTVDGKVVKKSSTAIEEGEHIVTVEDQLAYVSRGGLKLEAALAAFDLDPTGMTVADIGASTGGFTDCLLQRGAARVYAVDAGHGQLHPRLLADPRVRSAEGVNARELTAAHLIRVEQEWQKAHPDGVMEPFSGQVDGVVMDVSFISQTLLHPALASILRDGGWMVALVKPQFELTRSALNKQGIVKQEKDRKAAVDRVLQSAAACGFEAVSVIPSPIEGGDGNREFLGYFVKKT